MKNHSIFPLPVIIAVLLQGIAAYGADPDFGPNVLIFDPSMNNIQAQIDPIGNQQKGAEFGGARYAYLFKPGTYNINVQVGFYMQVLGLGPTPDAVVITGGVRSNSSLPKNNVTCAFWRSCENFSFTGNDFSWALSQGTDIRRVHAKGSMSLSIGGWASGGFDADCKVDGNINSGGQQQWFSRNTDMGAWTGGSWNMVFVGCPKAPAKWPINTAVDKTPLIAEKPYLFIDNTGHYSVMVPAVRRDSAGTDWSAGTTSGTSIPIEQFFLARADKGRTDTAATINAALASGKNVILCPGIYHLEDSIKVTRAGTVVLGIGYPTLIPDKGTPAIKIADVNGVKVGGLLLQASTTKSPTLLQVGEQGDMASHAQDPTVIYDIFARVGGGGPGNTDSMVTINSNDVIGDNAWLWRADHGPGASWDGAKNKNGIVVNGNNVIYYGLAVEHTQEYQVLWNGNGGRVYFYQSELPYDVPGGQKGWASYKVSPNVTSHLAYGVGIYSFNHGGTITDNAIEAAAAPGVKFVHMVLFHGGGGGISHTINGAGPSNMGKVPADMDQWP